MKRKEEEMAEERARDWLERYLEIEALTHAAGDPPPTEEECLGETEANGK
ncbi:MAG TPA: hypothetical protein PLU40_02960 [Methanoculleus sp.]|jgi:hypothetical protein|nr:hypothetical protein [Methanoculleus sp.]HPZ32504.1 hypothetical protein [Methanoculleus sp.]HQD23968.1 hypothetical protein [Methanoculleus sp.]